MREEEQAKQQEKPQESEQESAAGVSKPEMGKTAKKETSVPDKKGMDTDIPVTLPSFSDQSVWSGESSGANQERPIMSQMPLPVMPIYPGNVTAPEGYAVVRFLHAAVNYGPVNISIGSKSYATNVAYGSVSGYNRVGDGFKVVTITSARSPRGILFRKTIPFIAGTRVTLAIVNAANGMELLQISDEGCHLHRRNIGCFRVANLSYNSAPIDVVTGSDLVVFSEVAFKEVTAWKQARQGNYQFFVIETPRRFRAMPLDLELLEPRQENENFYLSGYQDTAYLLSFYVQIQPGRQYTAYLIGNDGFTPALQVLLIEN